MLKEKSYQPRILYSTKVSIKYESTSQTFSESLGESSFYVPILTELAEYVFHQNKQAKSEKGREDSGNHGTKTERKYWKFPD